MAHVLVGYAAGAGWRHVQLLTGRAGLGLGLAVAAGLAVAWLRRRSARAEREPADCLDRG